MQSIDIFITLWFMFVDPTAMIAAAASCPFRPAVSSQAMPPQNYDHYYYYREKFLNHHRY